MIGIYFSFSYIILILPQGSRKEIFDKRRNLRDELVILGSGKLSGHPVVGSLYNL